MPLTQDDIETVRRECMARLHGVHPGWRRFIQILCLAALKRIQVVTPVPPNLPDNIDENNVTNVQLQLIAQALKNGVDPDNDPEMQPLRNLIQTLVP